MKQLATLPSALQSEKSTEFVKGLERTWVRHFGLPKYLRVDAAKGWESKAVRDWCSDQGVILEVAPPQSHSLELSSDDIKSFAELWNSTWMTKGVTLSVLKDAAIYVPPKLNGMSFTTGLYSKSMGVGEDSTTRPFFDVRALQPWC